MNLTPEQVESGTPIRVDHAKVLSDPVYRTLVLLLTALTFQLGGRKVISKQLIDTLPGSLRMQIIEVCNGDYIVRTEVEEAI